MPTEQTPTQDVTLRPGDRADLPRIADQFVRVRAGSVMQMPASVHSAERVREHFDTWDLTQREVWIAEAGERLLGHLVLKDAWVEGLYVESDAQRGGIGSALLDVAKLRRPNGFCLWVFVSNQPARAFYRAHGLIDLEATDGSWNEERAPDLRMVWPGADPLAFLRGLVDEVDEQLGDLLARRVALTRAVQPHKTRPGRDPGRERAIAATVARHVPDLGPERVERIMGRIITESLGSLDDDRDR